jgi:hypothetical protein
MRRLDPSDPAQQMKIAQEVAQYDPEFAMSIADNARKSAIQIKQASGASKLNVTAKVQEAEAYASHIGQFIHKGGTLDRLRSELPKIQLLEFMEVEVGKKTPIKVNVHHKSEELLKTHEELAALHRGYEQRVNYFKSKVKNSVTKENARISKLNADAQAEVNEKNALSMHEYSKKRESWLADYKKAQLDFETVRQNKITEAVNLKIEVDARFQPVVDEFLKQLEK